MKGLLLAANLQQLFQAGEHPGVMAFGIRKLCIQCLLLPLAAIDGAVVPRVRKTLVIVAGGKKAVKVDARNAFEGQHDGVGAEKALQLPLVLTRLTSAQGVEEGDVYLI